MLSFFLENVLEAGCDEAGRGCLAGPVFAAAVILPADFFHPLLNDSKQLSEKERDLLRPIIEKEALSFAVEMVDNETIDKINILNASILGMQNALNMLSIEPQHIIVDGNRFKPFKNIPYKCIVGGDAKYASIAAASVLAKTYRDEYMCLIDKEFPEYLWKQNKAYPTVAHRKAIEIHGITKYHRKTFRLLNTQTNLF